MLEEGQFAAYLGAQQSPSSIYGQFGVWTFTACSHYSLILSCSAKYQPSDFLRQHFQGKCRHTDDTKPSNSWLDSPGSTLTSEPVDGFLARWRATCWLEG